MYHPRSPRLSLSTQTPDHDAASADEPPSPSPPPKYEPMYDYLRSHHERSSRAARNELRPGPATTPAGLEPYRDDPFGLTGERDASQPPPPSYEELYRRNEAEAGRLLREFDLEGSPAEQTEELVKWVVAMLLICLTIAAVGTAFNWGRP
ncbi:unnamed protein product [Diplocarpon coronariae]